MQRSKPKSWSLSPQKNNKNQGSQGNKASFFAQKYASKNTKRFEESRETKSFWFCEAKTPGRNRRRKVCHISEALWCSSKVSLVAPQRETLPLNGHRILQAPHLPVQHLGSERSDIQPRVALIKATVELSEEGAINYNIVGEITDLPIDRRRK